MSWSELSKRDGYHTPSAQPCAPINGTVDLE
jgi:hypothetical protein